MKYRETSSDESEETSDNESDYEVSESSDDDGSWENMAITTRTSAKSVMISIPEATKMRPRNAGISIREPIPEATKMKPRNSGISIREPIESPIPVGSPWQKRRKRETTGRRPAERFKNLIVGSSSSAGVNGGNKTTSFESGINPSSARLQGYIFGSSSSGSNMERPWSVSASGPIPSSSSVEAQANIRRQLTSSSSSLHVRCMDLNQPATEDDNGKQVEEEEEEKGLDLNQPANEEDDEKMVVKEDGRLDLNQPAKEDEEDGDVNKNEGLDLNQPARDE